MPYGNSETITITERVMLDGRKHLKRIDLSVDGCPRASLEEQLNGNVHFRFEPVGTFTLIEARAWIQGLLELSMMAEQLEMEASRRVKNQKR